VLFVSPEIVVTVFRSLLSGIIIGFTLGMVGGGGSILAVPLLIYVVGKCTNLQIITLMK
jgi:uncharacterized membrane protein YfcA